MNDKFLAAFQVATANPSEALDRISLFVLGRLGDYLDKPHADTTTEWHTALSAIEWNTGWPIQEVLSDDHLDVIEAELTERNASMPTPFSLAHNAGVRLGRLCYAICRVLKPSVVVETGVGYGVTSTYILRAMELTRKGHLHSIDLPPLTSRGQERAVGGLIPADSRRRWTLHRGNSLKLLPGLVEQLCPIDLFVHDSLHTERAMNLEFRAVEKQLNNPSVVLADDVHGNRAFSRFVARHDFNYSYVIEHSDKAGQLGMAISSNGTTRDALQRPD